MRSPAVSAGGGARSQPRSEDGSPSENKSLRTARGGGRDNMSNVVKCNSLPSLLDDHDASPGAHFTSLAPTYCAPAAGALQRCRAQQRHGAQPPSSLPSLLDARGGDGTSESRAEGKRLFRSRGGGGRPGPEATLRRSADNIHAEATYVRSFEDYIAVRQGGDRAGRAEMNGVPKPKISAKPLSAAKRGPPVPPKPIKITRKGDAARSQLDRNQKDAKDGASAQSGDASGSNIHSRRVQQGCPDVAESQANRSAEESSESGSNDANSRITGQTSEMPSSSDSSSTSSNSQQGHKASTTSPTSPGSQGSGKIPSASEGRGASSAARTRKDTMPPAAAVTAGRPRDRALSRPSPTRSASATDLRAQDVLGGGRASRHSRTSQHAGDWQCALAGGSGAARTEGERGRIFERAGKPMSVSNENVNSLQVGKDLLYKKSFGLSLTDIVGDKTIFPLGIPQPLTSSGSEDSHGGGLGDWSLGSTESLRAKGDGASRRSARSGIITTPRLSRKAVGAGEGRAGGEARGHKKSKMHRPLMPITVPRIKKGTRRPSFRAVQDR